jgi:hypothetical protein
MPESIDPDLSFGSNASSRFLTAGFALGDEIIIRLCSKRQSKKDQAQAEGRYFHDRSFRGRYQEIDGPISPALPFGTATNWHDQLEKTEAFPSEESNLNKAEFGPYSVHEQGNISACPWDASEPPKWRRRSQAP